MHDAIVLRQDQHDITTLTLNHPDKFNALSSDMMRALHDHLDDIAADESVRVVIISARGRAFSAGHDLKEVRHREDEAYHCELFRQCSSMMMRIHQLPQPVIAAVQGIATAAGCQLVANCDLAVASDDARFAVSGINFGLFCSTPAVALSRNMHRKQAMKMLLTGEFISAAKALEFGLVNEVVSPAKLDEATRSIARSIAEKPVESIALGKELFYRQLSMEMAEAYEYASQKMAQNMNMDVAKEGIDAFLEKRQPNWQSRE